MAQFYAYRIKTGKTTLDNVPEVLREQVEALLKPIEENHSPAGE